MGQLISRVINNEEFIFDYRRVIYWPRRKILLAADLHWGKTEYLRNHGIAISDNVFDADLLRLSHIMDDYEVSTLMVLGDLIHHEKALSRGVVEKVARFRHENNCELLLIKGNHDRYTEFPSSWAIVEESEFYLDSFYFSHEYKDDIEAFQFSGHVHPMIRLRAGMDSLRLPSFILGDDFCLLPAFSQLTGGQDVKLRKGQEALVVMDDGIETF
jgi:uncharacterized protein